MNTGLDSTDKLSLPGITSPSLRLATYTAPITPATISASVPHTYARRKSTTNRKPRGRHRPAISQLASAHEADASHLTKGEFMSTKSQNKRASQITRPAVAKLRGPAPVAVAESLDDHKLITDERANRLMSKIFAHCPKGAEEADELFRDIVVAFDILADESDEDARSAAANLLTEAAFRQTMAYSERLYELAMSAEHRPAEMAA